MERETTMSDLLKFGCPVHRDVVLFTTPPAKPDDETLRIPQTLHTCPKCNKKYPTYECVLVEDVP